MGDRTSRNVPYAHETEAALAAARRAGAVALEYAAAGFIAEEKSDLSPVTIADRECERAIAEILSAAFPDDGIVGEEGAERATRSGRRWIVDPIDGTRDFVRRTPYWAVQIALEDAGRIVLGIIHLPAQGDTVLAVAGGGCFHNGQPVRASSIDRIDKAVLMISGFKHAWAQFPPDAVRRLTETAWTVRAYSGCYDVTLLARGMGDIWLSGSGMEWDYAPGRIIAEECGARFFTNDGSDSIDRNHCVICVPGVEDEVRRVLMIPPRQRAGRDDPAAPARRAILRGEGGRGQKPRTTRYPITADRP